MTIAAVHISPIVSIPVSAVLAVVLLWYWVQMGDPAVPRSRRWVRRVSLALSFAVLVASVIGVSFVDPVTQQTAYVVTWATVIFIILLIMLTAVADIFNSLRLQRELRARMEIDAAAELHRTIKHQTSASSGGPRFDSPTTNGARGKHGAHP